MVVVGMGGGEGLVLGRGGAEERRVESPVGEGEGETTFCLEKEREGTGSLENVRVLDGLFDDSASGAGLSCVSGVDDSIDGGGSNSIDTLASLCEANADKMFPSCSFVEESLSCSISESRSGIRCAAITASADEVK